MKAVLFALSLIAALYVGAPNAAAQTNIAIVDVQRLMVDSAGAKDIQAQVQAKRETLQEEFMKFENDLRASEKELVELRQSLSQEDFAEKRKAFEEDLIEKRRVALTEKKDMEEAVIEASARLRGEIVKIVAEQAEERDVDLVLSKQNVVLVEKSLDLTPIVMEELNKRLSSIKVNLK